MSPWATLGVERTDDVAEVRRAYARKLKAIDVDADPDAFIALRSALDEALAQVRWGDMPEVDLIEDAELPQGDLDAEPHQPGADVYLPVAPAMGDPDEEARRERLARLDRMLFPGEGAPPPDADELADAVQAILDDPAMAQVDHAARVEDWLGGTLYDSVPRSDPVIPMVIRHFRWDENEGRIDQLWYVDELIQRRRAFDVLDRLADPRNEHHKAYLDLTSDEIELSWTSMFRSSQVGTLLFNIRDRAPAAEEFLAPHRVALWDARLSRSISGGLKWAMIIFWGLFIIGKFVAAASDTTSPDTGRSPYDAAAVFTDPAADINPILAEASNHRLNMLELPTRNSELHERLMERWQAARDDPRNSGPTFYSDVRRILGDTARSGLREGGYAIQTAYWRMRADELTWLRGIDVAECDRVLRGAMYTRTPPEGFASRRNAIIARGLALARGTPRPSQEEEAYQYRVSGQLLQEVGRRSGLDRGALERALNDGGSPVDNCNARIALIEAALDLPEAEGAAFLREMSRGL